MIGDPFIIRKNRSSFHRDIERTNYGVILIIILIAFGLAASIVSYLPLADQPAASSKQSIDE